MIQPLMDCARRLNYRSFHVFRWIADDENPGKFTAFTGAK